MERKLNIMGATTGRISATEASHLRDKISMKTETELQLIRQVGEWAEKNFGINRKPELGVIEEIGEAAHACLKKMQGIRGYDKEEKFIEDFTDSLGDCVIFLSDWCAINNAYFQLHNCVRITNPNDLQEDVVLQHLLQAASGLFIDYSTTQEGTNPIYSSIAQHIVQGLTYWANIYGFDLDLIIGATWAKVQKRDWNKDKLKGGE